MVGVLISLVAVTTTGFSIVLSPIILSILPSKIRKKLLKHEHIKNIAAISVIFDIGCIPFSIYDKVLNEDIVNNMSERGLFNFIKSYDDQRKYKLLTKEYIYKKLSNYCTYGYEIDFDNEIYYHKYLSFLKNHDSAHAVSFIKHIKDESLKASLLSSISLSSSDTYNVIENMSDDNKIKFFDKLNLYEQTRLVKNLLSDELKIKYLEDFPLERKWIIICSLSDELKLNYLYEEEYEEYKTSIIKSINNKDILLKIFDLIKDKQEQIDFIIQITSLSAKYEIYKRIPNLTDEERFDIINDIMKYEDDPNKIENLAILISNYKLSNMLINSKKDKKEVLKDINITYINPNIDKKITIGLELETSNEKCYIYEKLDNIIEGWEVTKDSSVTSGIEIKSPILNYDLESLKEIFYICNTLKENNFFENETCAGHIHIGFDYFKTKEELITFYNIFCNCEYIFYLISNRENDEIRKKIIRYSKPISGLISENINKYSLKRSKNLHVLVDKLKDMQYSSRDYSINIKNAFKDDKNTIEYRIPNGEIEYEELMHNIILLTSLVTVSKEMTHKDNNQKHKYLDLIINNNLDEETKLEYLLYILFEDDEDLKQIYRNRFYSNNIDNEINRQIKKYIRNVAI